MRADLFVNDKKDLSLATSQRCFVCHEVLREVACNSVSTWLLMHLLGQII